MCMNTQIHLFHGELHIDFCFIWQHFWNLYNVVQDCHFYSWIVLYHYLQNVCILCLSLFSDRLLRAAHISSREEPQILMHFRKASSNFSLQHSALWPEYSSGLFPQASGAGTYWRHCRICKCLTYQIQQNLFWPQNSWNTEISRETLRQNILQI